MRNYIASGIGIIYLLILVGLVAAKLAGHIHWAWGLVLCPLWAPVVLVVLLVIISIAGLGSAMDRGENPFQ